MLERKHTQNVTTDKITILNSVLVKIQGAKVEIIIIIKDFIGINVYIKKNTQK